MKFRGGKIVTSHLWSFSDTPLDFVKYEIPRKPYPREQEPEGEIRETACGYGYKEEDNVKSLREPHVLELLVMIVDSRRVSNLDHVIHDNDAPDQIYEASKQM